MRSLRLGVIGLGRMGLPIADALVRAGFEVCGFDVVPERVAAAVSTAGIAPAASAEEVAAAVDLVVTILPGAAEFAEVMAPESPVLAAIRPGGGWLDLTSNDPRHARAAFDASAERGVFGVGAPMGGGVDAAHERTLRFYVGGTNENLAAVRAVLETLGGERDDDAVEHVGQRVEDGYIAKLIANQLWFGQVTAVTESLLLAQKLGLEPAALTEILTRSAGTSAYLERHSTNLLDGDYMATFGLDRCVEELQILSSLSRDATTPFELSNLVTRLHEDALQRFGAVDGELLVARLLEENAGTTLRREPSTP